MKKEKILLGKKGKITITISLITVVCLLAICLLSVIQHGNDTTEALTDSSKAKYVDELTINGDGKAINGNVFNGNRLKELYKLLLGDNATFATVQTKANETKSSPAGGTGGLSKGKNVNDFTNKNVVVKIGGINWIAMVLTVDKLNGDVVLTLWRESIPNDDAHKAKYCPWPASSGSSSSINHTYPGNVYGTSYVRSLVLNGYDMTDGEGSAGNKITVEYSTASDKKTQYVAGSTVQTANYEYDLFTNTSYTNNLTDYIVKPTKIAYQETQDRHALEGGSVGSTSSACYGTPTNGYYWTVSGYGNYLSKYAYNDWQYDYLWLPSAIEVRNSSTIFRCTSEAKNDNVGSWCREGAIGSTNRIDDLNANGSGNTHYVAEVDNGIRPAFHLNLTKAERDSATLLELPTNTEKTYNGTYQTVDKGQNWYDSTLFGDSSSGKLVEITYYDEYNLNYIDYTNVKPAGTYTARFRITDSSHTQWADATSATDVERTCKFKIEKKSVRFDFSMQTSASGVSEPVAEPNAADVCTFDKAGDGTVPAGFFQLRYTNDTGYNSTKYPKALGPYKASVEILNPNYCVDVDNTTQNNEYSFNVTERRVVLPTFISNGGDSQTYSGGARSFVLEYDKEEIEISEPTDMNGKISWDENTDTVIATQAGDYYLNLHIIDNTGAALWYDSANHNDRQLAFHVTPYEIIIDVVSLTGDTISVEYGTNANISVEIDKAPVKGSVDINIMAAMGKMTPFKIGDISGVSSGDYGNAFTCELNTENLASGTWVLSAQTSDSNYTVSLLEERSLSIEEQATDTALTWRLFKSGLYQGKNVKAEVDETDVKFDTEILYDGKAYSFKINRAPSGYTLDVAYKEDGFAKGYRTLDVATNKPVLTDITNAGVYKTQVRLLSDEDNSLKLCEIEWKIIPAKFDLSGVKWIHDGQLPYDRDNGCEAVLDPKTVPTGLIPVYENNSGANVVGTQGEAEVSFKLADGYEGNYILPTKDDADSYIDPNEDFAWKKLWSIVKAVIQSSSWKNSTQTDPNNKMYESPILRDPRAEGGVVEYEYYETDQLGNIKDQNNPLTLDDIVWSESEAKYYIAKPKLMDTINYEFDNDEAVSKIFRVGKELAKVQVYLESSSMEYNTNPRHAKLRVANGALSTNAFELTYYDGYTRLATAPIQVGNYRVEVSLKPSFMDKYQIDGNYEFDFEITQAKIAIDWNYNAKPCTLKLKYGQINGVEYEMLDKNDNPVEFKDLKAGEKYTIRAKIKDNQRNNFIFVDEASGETSYETDWEAFEVKTGDKLVDPNDPTNPSYPQTDPDLPTDDPSNPNDQTPSGDTAGGTVDFGNVGEMLKQWWQVIVSGVSILLTVIFLAKTASNESKRRNAKRIVNERYKTYYAAATGLFGLSMSNWTVIACALAGVAVLSFGIMIISGIRRSKAERELEAGRVTFDQRKDDDLKTMLMHMLGGGMGAQMNMSAQPIGIDTASIQGMLNDAVAALLPGVQQALPQQASTNDELVQRLIDENAKSQEKIQELMERLSEQPVERIIEKEVASSSANDEIVQKLIDQNEKLMQKLAEQQTTEKVIEREVASSGVSDETINKLMDKILELSSNQNAQPQVVEKVIEKEVPVEKVVEKIVEVPVEKVVEKIVEKEVKVAAPAKPKKEVAPRLTLDEAYALLSKQQKKYFDGLKEYALSKPNSKEKKSTYAITIGQSTVNPLLKLTIKKDMTVALFKMEDEYLKDIKRDASSDGTKVKVKETEVVIADAQACKVAKNMIDLREDQIERYNDLLKEQRAMSKRK